MPRHIPKRHRDNRPTYGYEESASLRGQRGRGSRKDKDDNKGEIEDHSSFGGAAGRMGGMPMGGMYGGMAGGDTSNAASSSAGAAVDTTEAAADSYGTPSAYTVDTGAAGEPSDVVNVPDDAPSVDPVGLSGGGGGASGGSGADESANVADIASASDPSINDLGTSSSGLESDVAVGAVESDMPTLGDVAVAGTVAAGTAVGAGTQVDVIAEQPVEVLSLRELFKEMGFTADDSDLLVHVIADGSIDSSELEQLSNIQYPKGLGNLLGRESWNNGGAADMSSAIPEPERDVSIPDNVSGDIQSDQPTVDATSADISGTGQTIDPDTPKVRITMDKDGNVRIVRDNNEDGHPDIAIDIDKDNNVEFSSYENESVEDDELDVPEGELADDKDLHEAENSSSAKANAPVEGASREQTTASAGSENATDTRSSSGSGIPAAAAATVPAAVAATTNTAGPTSIGDNSDSTVASDLGNGGVSTGDVQPNDQGNTVTTQDNGEENVDTGGGNTPTPVNSSDFEYLSTEYFDDAERAAKQVAETVRGLKRKIQTADYACNAKWLGKGHKEFTNLAYTIEIQLKDISDEFWAFYEELIDAHDAYLTADEEAATEVNSVFG